MEFSSYPPDLALARVSTVPAFTSFMTFGAGGTFCNWVDFMCLHKLSNKSFTVICQVVFYGDIYWRGLV